MNYGKSPRKFLLTTWEGGGSVGPALTVARKLLQAGHDIRVMSDACNRAEAEATGARFIPWTRAPSRADKSRDSEVLSDWQFSTFPEAIDSIFDVVTIGPALDYARDVMEELQREPADLVVANELTMGPALGCEAAGQEFALLACNSLAFPLDGAPVNGPYRDRKPPPEEAATQAATMNALGAVFARHLPVLNKARAALGLGPLDNLFAQLRPASKTLIAVSRSFDFAKLPDPPGFAYVGPQLDDVHWAEPWTSPWESSDD